MGLGAAGVSSLAGCSSQNQAKNDSTTVSIEPPQVDTLQGTWKETDTASVKQTIEMGITFGTAHGKVKMFTHVPAQEQVRSKTRGEFSRDVGIGFASKLELEGALLSNIPTQAMVGSLSKKFKTRLRKRGVQSITSEDVTNKSVEPENADGTAKLQGFSGMFPVGPFQISVPLQTGKELSFRFERQHIELNAILAVWKSDGYLFAAGGAWPAAPFSDDTEWETVTGGEVGDGADVKVRITLPFTQDIESHVVKLAESVH